MFIFVSIVILYTFSLIVFHEFCRRKISYSILVLVIYALSLPLWLGELADWFRISKTISMLVPVLFLAVARYAYQKHSNNYFLALLRKKWLMSFFYFMTLLNILEATAKDFTSLNYANALCGIVLIITLARANNWRIKNNEKNDILVNMPMAWCLLYSTWNLAFVYAERPDYLAHSFCLLLAPIIYATIFKRADLWMSARVYTLVLGLAIKGTYDFITPLINTFHLENDFAIFIWGGINLFIAAVYFIYWLRQKKNISV